MSGHLGVFLGGPPEVQTWFYYYDQKLDEHCNFGDGNKADFHSHCGCLKPLIKRERVFSRLLVTFRVDQPHSWTQRHKAIKGSSIATNCESWP